MTATSARGRIKQGPALSESGSRVNPIYHRLYVHLRELIVGDALDAGIALPSEPALAERFGVSRVTVRKTLTMLESEGLVKRIWGVGTFPVAQINEHSRKDISGSLENMISYEGVTSARTIEWKKTKFNEAMAKVFGAAEGLRIVRVREYRNKPISFTTIHLPARFAVILDRKTMGDRPVVEVLGSHGVKPEQAEQVITAVAATAQVADNLGIKTGAPLICMRRLMLDYNRHAIVHQESLYAPDEFEYRMTLTRSKLGPVARWSPIA